MQDFVFGIFSPRFDAANLIINLVVLVKKAAKTNFSAAKPMNDTHEIRRTDAWKYGNFN